MAVERRCKASSSEFKTIWPGLKRCMVCGFALATEDTEDGVKYPKEDSLHSTYHGKFYKAKSEYGSSHVLEYKVLKQKEETLIANLEKIKSYDFSEDIAEILGVFDSVSEILARVEDWKRSFESVESEYIQNFVSEISNNISNMRSIISKRDNAESQSVEVYQEMIYELLPDYRNLFDNIQNIIMTKTSQVIKGSEELDSIPLPNFSFNTNDKVTYLESVLQIIPTKQSKLDMIMNELYTVEFTRSLRLWDMCKAHPRFEDYIALLWNTPKFLNFIKPYMTDVQFNTFVAKYKANRQLYDYGFSEAPFYFGKVSISDECSMRRKSRKKEKKCSKDCKNCEYGYRDLTYTDRLADISDDDDTSDGYENTVEYQKTAKSMEALGKIFNK